MESDSKNAGKKGHLYGKTRSVYPRIEAILIHFVVISLARAYNHRFRGTCPALSDLS
jgi:hypothetical protein